MANIIFDFDGTIADSFEVIISIIKKLTHGNDGINESKIRELRKQPTGQIIKSLNVRTWQLPLLLLRGRFMMRSRMNEIKIFDGMPKTIQELHAEGHNLFIVSSNSPHNVNKFLKKHRLGELFVDIEGNVSLFGKDKSLRKVIKKNSLVPRETWYVGDETRDIVAATATDLRSIAVTWGFTDREVLAVDRPTALAEKPADIMTILNDSSIIR
jgi:phosphoglycolate phosphatase